MKKHIIGFAIFSLIVVAAIALSLQFYNSPAPVLTNEPDYTSSTKNSCWKMKREPSKTDKLISYKIEEISITNKNILTAKIQFAWNGGEATPDALSFNVKFFTEAQPLKAVEVAMEAIQTPFAESKTITKTFTVNVKNKKLINPRENYYAYLDISSMEFAKSDAGSEQKNGVLNRIILDEKEMLADAVPVTFVHDK